MGNMSAAVRAALSNFTNFSGRAARAEYWWWALSVFILLIIVGLIDAVVIAPILGFEPGDENAGQPLSVIVSLVLLIPNIAVGVRRLHDSDRSGWWLLLSFIPILGFLVLIYFLVQPSSPGENRFGPKSTWRPAA